MYAPGVKNIKTVRIQVFENSRPDLTLNFLKFTKKNQIVTNLQKMLIKMEIKSKKCFRSKKNKILLKTSRN